MSGLERPDPEPTSECDIVMKGGVASGLVYARTFTVLSRKYRFRSIAGSSAGAIAAALVSAAEYARQKGDQTAFSRLQQRCEALPQLLPGFFQADPHFRALLKALIHIAPGTGRARIGSAVMCFWQPILSGALAGLAAMTLVNLALGVSFRNASAPLVAAPGLFLAAVIGATAWLAWSLSRSLLVDLPKSNFGLSRGHNAGTGPPDITDWIHETVQEIAFGVTGRAEPLTFGDLASCGIDLRIIATNLSFARMEVLPALGSAARFRPAEWKRLFPPALLEHLNPTSSTNLSDLPPPKQLPVLAAVRLSIACPGLLEVVPVHLLTGERVIFADGGLTQNFPFDIFDELVPERPTFAFDLATLHGGEFERVTTLSEGLGRQSRPIHIQSLQSFLWSLIVALREGATRTAMLQGPNPDRIFQAWLTADEGGMDLDMGSQRAQDLMSYGEDLGEHVLQRFDFTAHRADRLIAARRRVQRFRAGLMDPMDLNSPDEASL